MFGKLHKGWKSGKDSSVVGCYEYNADRDLCVQTIFVVYLERTKQWTTDQKKQILMSKVNQHKEVCGSTISRWIIKVLNIGGIDTSAFKENSSRSAASSGEESAGSSISDILSMV